jgi:hypothetical protein
MSAVAGGGNEAPQISLKDLRENLKEGSCPIILILLTFGSFKEIWGIKFCEGSHSKRIY